MLVILTYERGHTILFTRYTLTSARISIIPEFIEKLELNGLYRQTFMLTKDEIINKKSGSKIIFQGYQDKLRRSDSKPQITYRHYHMGSR